MKRYTTKGFRDEYYRDHVATDEVRVKRINKVIEELCAARERDYINGRTTAAKIRTSFVQGVPQGIFDAAYERWNDAGRPDDPSQVTSRRCRNQRQRRLTIPKSVTAQAKVYRLATPTPFPTEGRAS